MIKDFLISFTDNFKEKTKNPFLGTYLLVWMIRNWDLIYTIFNFDEDFTLYDKKSFISNYFIKGNFIDDLLTNIFWTFCLLILTYLLLNFSRFIVNLSEKQITPWVYKITDSKSIVLKTEYERIRSDNDDLQMRLDKEREAKGRLENRIKSLETEIIEITRVKAETEAEAEAEQKVKNTLKRTTKSKPLLEDSITILFNKLKEKNLTKEFLDTCTKINRGDDISNTYKFSEKFIELGLIKFSQNSIHNSKRYNITPDGELLLKKIRLE